MTHRITIEVSEDVWELIQDAAERDACTATEWVATTTAYEARLEAVHAFLDEDDDEFDEEPLSVGEMIDLLRSRELASPPGHGAEAMPPTA